MGPRKITLRKDEQCIVCAAPLSARSPAWWDDVARTITCVTCAATASAQGTGAAAPSRPRGPTEPPAEQRPTAARTKRAIRDARFSGRLRSDLAGRAVVLDDRRVPRTKSSIDHVVIAASGVWIVDTMSYTGKVVHRDIGSFLRTETRLFVDGRDRTALVAGLDGQALAVRHALTEAGMGAVPVRAVLCFINSDWGLLAKPFAINGVLVTWASKLSQRILDGPPEHLTEPMHLAAVLSAALPATA
jgi:hypothetical protein